MVLISHKILHPIRVPNTFFVLFHWDLKNCFIKRVCYSVRTKFHPGMMIFKRRFGAYSWFVGGCLVFITRDSAKIYSWDVCLICSQKIKYTLNFSSLQDLCNFFAHVKHSIVCVFNWGLIQLYINILVGIKEALL